MQRLVRYPVVLSTLLVLTLVTASGLANGLASTQAASLSILPGTSAASEAMTGPGAHFGFSQASILAQATPTLTPTRTPTVTPTVTPTRTPTPTGSLQVCKRLTVGTLRAVAFTFTTPPGGPTIPSITVAANTAGPACAAVVTVPVGSVSVTENVTSGFPLESVTGGTLVGTTATANITAGETTLLTFVNNVSGVIPPVIPTEVPTAAVSFPLAPSLGLPPSPLQFLPPPPPPLLPPPPPAPMGVGAAQPGAAFPEIPVIPEAESLLLLASGLLGLGGLAALRAYRRRKT